MRWIPPQCFSAPFFWLAFCAVMIQVNFFQFECEKENNGNDKTIIIDKRLFMCTRQIYRNSSSFWILSLVVHQSVFGKAAYSYNPYTQHNYIRRLWIKAHSRMEIVESKQACVCVWLCEFGGAHEFTDTQNTYDRIKEEEEEEAKISIHSIWLLYISIGQRCFYSCCCAIFYSC